MVLRLLLLTVFCCMACQRIVRYDFPDAGVSCWLFTPPGSGRGALSCAKVNP